MSLPLYEKYRPSKLSEVVGQPKAIKQIESVGDPGGKSYWISGASGTGKTTLAKIIGALIADDFFVSTTVGRAFTVKAIKETVQDWQLSAWGKGGRAYIINESHGLSAPSIELLLDVLEMIPAHVVVIFTTTKEGQAELFEDHIDASPLCSRCFDIALTNQGLAKLFAAHVQGIAQLEGLDGQPIAAYIKLAQKCKNNMRAMLQAVAAGVMKV